MGVLYSCTAFESNRQCGKVCTALSQGAPFAILLKFSVTCHCQLCFFMWK